MLSVECVECVHVFSELSLLFLGCVAYVTSMCLDVSTVLIGFESSVLRVCGECFEY